MFLLYLGREYIQSARYLLCVPLLGLLSMIIDLTHPLAEPSAVKLLFRELASELSVEVMG